MNHKNYRSSKNIYQRPKNKYSCGNNGLWKKSCWQGPDSKGRCGGISDCIPFKKGDIYICSRPDKFGGICSKGADIDGFCQTQHTPCKPKLKLFYTRKYFSYLVVLFIAAFLFFTL